MAPRGDDVWGVEGRADGKLERASAGLSGPVGRAGW